MLLNVFLAAHVSATDQTKGIADHRVKRTEVMLRSINWWAFNDLSVQEFCTLIFERQPDTCDVCIRQRLHQYIPARKLNLAIIQARDIFDGISLYNPGYHQQCRKFLCDKC